METEVQFSKSKDLFSASTLPIAYPKLTRKERIENNFEMHCLLALCIIIALFATSIASSEMPAKKKMKNSDKCWMNSQPIILFNFLNVQRIKFSLRVIESFRQSRQKNVCTRIICGQSWLIFSLQIQSFLCTGIPFMRVYLWVFILNSEASREHVSLLNKNKIKKIDFVLHWTD